MSLKEARNTREIIEAEYPEFPETILHAELCRACARVDGRSIQHVSRDRDSPYPLLCRSYGVGTG